MILAVAEAIKNIKNVVENRKVEDIDVKRSYNIHWYNRIAYRDN